MTGGLTGGGRMAKYQCIQWLLSMTACADVNIVMQDLTETTYLTSDQHEKMNPRLYREGETMTTCLFLGSFSNEVPLYPMSV